MAATNVMYGDQSKLISNKAELGAFLLARVAVSAGVAMAPLYRRILSAFMLLLPCLLQSGSIMATESTPTPTANAVTSISRETFQQMLKETFAFTEPVNVGGEVVIADTAGPGTLNPLL